MDIQHASRELSMPPSAYTSTATHFNPHRKTLARAWKDFIWDGSSRSKGPGRVSRKALYTKDRKLKDRTLQRRSSRLKPLLTDANKEERVAFSRLHVRCGAGNVLALLC
ncbi:hypothetical protein H257_08131 [Aphanomyces astaci]|uniref:Uncharacterized protein n=1 Tax=Aphanomyces astaci TaxID=112090 RepID=W4GH91_APHAT|nr:hypothetical protein H257_08131 [Aphanomyces astaci]ETV78641.1 hypothetical protein H257_08131 [Aphanomyces astaci]|eukprot:XP_009832222.1 hypothetical protein H257_08131 [Aphanomyces astaci]